MPIAVMREKSSQERLHQPPMEPFLKKVILYIANFDIFFFIISYRQFLQQQNLAASRVTVKLGSDDESS